MPRGVSTLATALIEADFLHRKSSPRIEIYPGKENKKNKTTIFKRTKSVITVFDVK